MGALYENKKRSITPDVCRGIAIFLVVWGHVLQQGLHGVANVPENLVVKIIYSFHMPLFVLISGYFFYASYKKKSSRELIFNRAVGMLKVIFIWNTIHYFVAMLLESRMGQDGMVSVRGWWSAVLEGYWFLWAMLFCTVAVGITTKYIPKRFWIVGFGIFVPLALWSPCRWVILSVYPFYIGGFLYHKAMEEGKKVPKQLMCAVPVLYVAVLVVYLFLPAIGNSEWIKLIRVFRDILAKTAGMRALVLQAGNIFLYYVLGILGSVSVIIIVNAVTQRMRKSKLLDFLGRLGQNSLQIYILQRIFLELLLGKGYQMAVRTWESNPVAENVAVFTWVGSFLISVICVGGLYGMARYVLRGKVSTFLFGR